jgi:outer membrane protein assembly factor BamB
MTALRTLALALAILLTAPALFAEASDAEWPQYRGPARDGSSPESGILAAWPAGGPKVVWKRSIGTGFSGLTVSGGRIFTMMAEGGEEHAVAFDAESGEELWRTPLGDEFPSEFGAGPRSTPAVLGGTAFFLGSYGDLVALATKNGKQRWSLHLTRDFGAMLPQHGFSTAPMVEGDMLVVEVGGGHGKAYAALDPKKGKTLWTTQDGTPTYTSPIAVTWGGERQLISLSDRRVVALGRDGELAWSHPWQGGIAMPIWIAPDKLFVPSIQGSMMAQLTESDGAVAVEQLWRSNEMKNHFNSSVVHDGYIYGFDNAILKCVSAETGERMWAKRGFGKGSLIVADGHLIILGERGQLAQAKASPEGFEEEGSVQALEGKCWTSPTLAGGRLYLRSLEQMVAFDVSG